MEPFRRAPVCSLLAPDTMKRSVFAYIAIMLATASAYAGPVESAIVAAMKLPDAANYSWVTTIDDDARTYEITGKTDKSDYSVVEMPMVAAVRRGVTRNSANSDNQVEAVFKGDEKLVIQTPTGWKTPEELAAAARSGYSGQRGGGMGGRRGGGRRGGFPGGGGPGGRDGTTPPVFSNLQLTLSRPAEEIGIIVASHTDLTADGDTVNGTLTETGAKLLLVHPGQKEITPLSAGGTFRLWIKDGVLVKYEVKLGGTLAVMTNGTRREVEVHQTATTELQNVGTTTLNVPDEAKKKLGP